MNTTSQVKKFILTDEYQRAFEHANTNLTIKAIVLKHGTTNLTNFRDFLTACYELGEVCSKYENTKKLLNLYLWLRTTLIKHLQHAGSNEVLKIACQIEIQQAEEKITYVCDQLAPGKITPLFSRIRAGANKCEREQ